MSVRREPQEKGKKSDRPGSSNGGPSPSSTPFTIQQNVAVASKKGQGQHNTKNFVLCWDRNFDPKDIVIQIRLVEGSKTIFARDVHVNRSPEKSDEDDSKRRSRSLSDCRSSDSGISTYRKKLKRNSKRRSRSAERSDKYRNDQKHSRSSKERHRNTDYLVDSAKSRSRKRSREKIPYFADPKREEDRIRRKYGESSHSHKDPSPKSNKYRNMNRSHSRERRRSHSREIHRSSDRERHRSSDRERHRSSDRKRHRSSDRERHRSSSQDRRRSSSRDRYRSRRQSPSFSRYRIDHILPQGPTYVPVVPIDYSYHPPWQLPPPYPRFPFMLRPPFSPPIPYYMLPRRMPQPLRWPTMYRPLRPNKPQRQ